MCKGWFASPSTLATPKEEIVHLNSHTASSMPTDTMPQRIAYSRTCAGLSCSAMAAGIGVHKDYYKLIEKKCDRISISHLLSIARITETDPEWLIYGDSLPRLALLSAPTIGQRLRQFRQQNGITGKALAQTAFGVNKMSSLSAWESDRMLPELRTLRLIADAYGISVMSFIPAPPASDPS